MIGVWLLAASTALGVTYPFTNLYFLSADGFPGSPPNAPATNLDGANPVGMILSGNTIYGSANMGGKNGVGTIFRVNTDGTHFTNLFDFDMGTYDSQSSTWRNSTGAQPNPNLVLVSNTLYGTTDAGGTFDAGVIFKVNTDGSGFGLITTFDFTNGAFPTSGLIFSSNTFYGATRNGTNDYGDIYKVDLSSLAFTKLLQFDTDVDTAGGMAISGNELYGIARDADSNFNGFIYRYGADGFTSLHSFDGTNGAVSWAAPVIGGNTLYGVTFQGGTNGDGSVFRIDLDGSHFTNLYSFTPANGANVDGSYPYDFDGLTLSGNTLYGTASGSGSGGNGTVFKINTDGTGFTTLHSFQYADGSQPVQIVLSGNDLLGIAEYGGNGVSLGVGTIFDISLQPKLPTLSITYSNDQVFVSWDDPSYSLYYGPSVTNISNPAFGSSPFPFYTFTSQQFFQLRPGN
jgi:uncharacterized repeat protein (TIGR03803 family)